MDGSKILRIGVLGVLMVVGVYVLYITQTTGQSNSFSVSGEAGFESEPTTQDITALRIGKGQNYTLDELRTYTREPGPWRVGLQTGHLDNAVMPEELQNLEGNTGASYRDLEEQEVMVEIVNRTAQKLEARGVIVDLLPATVPKGYKADAFVSVHADGNKNTNINGFKIAGPRIDFSGRAHVLSNALYASYEQATGLSKDTSITGGMTAYYAFNWPRYEYTVHPHTPSVIVETGFLTSPIDRAVIVDNPEQAAIGISDGIWAFLQDTNSYPIPQIVVPTLPVTGEVVCAPLRAERRASSRIYDCLPSIASKEGLYVALYGVGSTSPLVGQTITAQGNYMPAQMLESYLWFPYEVVGTVMDPAYIESVPIQ